ncbi:hypothetical protein N7495_001260 [Penicillium taxi]|uniref:uncharacterized protein n=1 Tax=Penicillium taxi TaxID=168475 RepID=UPI002544E139|nr:uncharacterized protein N7495_001260 [Penicillium taxi]KAJ5908578.1 hypothetical protein N7495_001260 [Penicillium taxi]
MKSTFSLFLRHFRLQATSLKAPSRRGLSTPPPPSPTNSQSRLRRFNDRLPLFLRTYTTPLLGAPVTHVTSFLILHEITAIVPLFGLVAAFHYNNWIPDLVTGSDENNAFDEGAARFGRWLAKKGWVDEADVTTVAEHEASALGKERAGVRLILEFATAYAITKALIPVRIIASVWATPWFARTILTPTTKAIQRVLGKS